MEDCGRSVRIVRRLCTTRFAEREREGREREGDRERELERESTNVQVNCSARDCPIFYAREKVRSELKDAYSVIERFGDPCW